MCKVCMMEEFVNSVSEIIAAKYLQRKMSPKSYTSWHCALHDELCEVVSITVPSTYMLNIVRKYERATEVDRLEVASSPGHF